MSIQTAIEHLEIALQELRRDATQGADATEVPEKPVEPLQGDTDDPVDEFEEDSDQPSIEKVRDAIEKASMVEGFGPLGVSNVMHGLGAQRLSDIKPEQYANFLEALEEGVLNARNYRA